MNRRSSARRSTSTFVVAFAAAAFTIVSMPAAAPSVAVATPGRAISWLSTGDSYSSGEGVRGNDGACAQSSEAWGPLAARLLDDEHDWHIDSPVFSACTGHLVQDMYNERPETDNPASLWEWALTQPGAPASGRFDVITMSFGGNDIGFADVILDCLAAPIHKYDSAVEVIDRGGWFGPVLAKDIISTSTADIVPFFGDDCNTQKVELERRVDMLFKPNACGLDAWRGGRSQYANYDCELIIDAEQGLTGSIVDFWLHVVATSLSSNGTLVVQGYPALFAESAEWGLGQALRCSGVTRGDANMLGGIARYLDAQLLEGVEGANRILGDERVVYSSVIDLYAEGGHSLCGSGDDWINGSITLTRNEPFLVPAPVTGTLTVNPAFRFRHLGAFHPKSQGHAEEARQVAGLLAARPQPTSASASPPVSLPSPTSSLALDDGGIGDARIGMEAGEVIDFLTAELGPPTFDQGWQATGYDPASDDDQCIAPEIRSMQWENLSVGFATYNPVEQRISDQRTFVSYFYMLDESGGDPLGLSTNRRLSLGSDASEVIALYPQALVESYYFFEQAVISGGLSDQGSVSYLEAGVELCSA